MPKLTAKIFGQKWYRSQEHLSLGAQPQAFEHRQVTRQANGQAGKDDVERDREPELDSGEQQRVHVNAASRAARCAA